MSSHHIVREKQEPALLVLGLDTFTDELLGQLLEWSPTVLVTAATAEKVDAMGIKLDIVIDANTEDLQSDIKTIPTGDDNPTETALKYLVAHNYPAVNIITDEFLLKDYLLFVDKINIVIYNGDQKIYPIASGFSKWKPAGERIRLINHPVSLHISGLQNIAAEQYMTTHDGFFTLQFDQPFIFISETIV